MTDGFSDLRAFLDRLRADRDLVEVDVPVDADQEAAEIHRRVIAAGGPALLFTKVEGAHFPLVTNLFGTARRAELAFGRRPKRLIERLVSLAEAIVPPTAGEAVGRARRGRSADSRRSLAPRRRPGDRDGRRAPGPRPAAHSDVVARGRRPVHHAPARLHRTPRSSGAQSRDLSAARLRPPDHRDALADRQGRRLPLRGRRGAGPAASGDRLPRRAAGARFSPRSRPCRKTCPSCSWLRSWQGSGCRSSKAAAFTR